MDFFVFALAAAASAPTLQTDTLREQILAADDVLFERAFNECDMRALEGILMPDARMFHDQAGMDEGRDAFMQPVRENICADPLRKPIRKRIDHTIRIDPLYDNGVLYGAIEQGQHEFYLREAGNPLQLTNRARFVIVWLSTDTGWKMKSTLSWDHLNPVENNPIDADVLEAGYDGFENMRYMMDAHAVSGQITAVVRDHRIVEQHASWATGSPAIATDTIFNVASLAKPVSAMLTLRLVEAGIMDLDEPISRHYVDPDIAGLPQAARVTPRMILSHSSGLPNWRYLDDGPEERLRFIAEPGEAYNYSGEGFEWLRKAIEAKTGLGWEELARTHVFEAAGMVDSSFLFPRENDARVAARYGADGEAITFDPHDRVNAAANLMTTAEDYARFVIFVMKGGGLSQQLAKEMLAAQIGVDETKSFGLGWQRLEPKGYDELILQHSGADAGVRSLAVAWPDKGQAIVILSNSESAIPTWGIILKEVFGNDGAAVIEANN